MSAPPPIQARARPALVLRAPNWVYAGAASVAGLALAVTVSVDATGGLSSDPVRQDATATGPGHRTRFATGDEHARHGHVGRRVDLRDRRRRNGPAVNGGRSAYPGPRRPTG